MKKLLCAFLISLLSIHPAYAMKSKGPQEKLENALCKTSVQKLKELLDAGACASKRLPNGELPIARMLRIFPGDQVAALTLLLDNDPAQDLEEISCVECISYDQTIEKRGQVKDHGASQGTTFLQEAAMRNLTDAACLLLGHDALKSLDLINRCTFGRLTAEDVYNKFLRGKWFGLINLFCHAGSLYFRLARKRITNLLIDYLQEEQPDMVISVVPLINGALLDATEQLNIPLIVIPTDLDSRTFVEGINYPSYKKFRYCLPFDDTTIKTTIKNAQICNSQVIVSGFPIRADFFEPKDTAALRQSYGIPTDTPVILLMLGGLGSADIVPFITQLKKIELPVHLLVCIGKSEHLRGALARIVLPEHINMTIVSFTNRVSDLMAIADLLITKSGSVSVCEGLYMGIPMLLDGTSSSILRWEKLNHSFIRKHHIGTTVHKHGDIAQLATKILTSKQKDAPIKNSFSFEKNDARKELVSVVNSLLAF